MEPVGTPMTMNANTIVCVECGTTILKVDEYVALFISGLKFKCLCGAEGVVPNLHSNPRPIHYSS